MRLERQELIQRLAAGESLEVSTGGGSYAVWAEPYAYPPRCAGKHTLTQDGRRSAR